MNDFQRYHDYLDGMSPDGYDVRPDGLEDNGPPTPPLDAYGDEASRPRPEVVPINPAPLRSVARGKPSYGDMRMRPDGTVQTFHGGFDGWMEQAGLSAQEIERLVANGAIARPPLGDGAVPTRLPTAFVWRDPSTIPARPWLYGRHLLRRQVSVTVAPGGVGKSSLTICEALAMASGRDLLGDWTAADLKVWIFNLEDPRDELERRVIAAALHHNVQPGEIDGRLFLDTGRERELCTAVQGRDGAHIVKPVIDALALEIEARGIDVLILDPFVSSHRVSENDNGAIDLVAKEWAKLADRCNCAIELVHHTRKTNGEEATTESGRGATALLAAARSGRVLNKMTDDQKLEAGVRDDPATYFAVTRDKANLAPAAGRVWRRMATVHLGNGDDVGVAEAWEWPDTFDGITPADLLAVQQAIDERCQAGDPPRYSDQSGADWAGRLVARVLGLDDLEDRKRIKRLIETWLQSGAIRKAKLRDRNRDLRPCLEVGEWASE